MEEGRVEQNHLLSLTPKQGNAADYGSLNDSRCHRGSDCDYEKTTPFNDENLSEIDSSVCESQLGESVRYRDHISHYTRERTVEVLD